MEKALDRYSDPISPVHIKLNDFQTRVLKPSSGSRYCVTIGCNVGLMPQYAVEGDIICVILNVGVPFAIRTNGISKHGVQSYALVGERCVCGLMKGDSLAMEEAEDITLV